jgi:hypothetical protein
LKPSFQFEFFCDIFSLTLHLLLDRNVAACCAPLALRAQQQEESQKEKRDPFDHGNEREGQEYGQPRRKKAIER